MTQKIVPNLWFDGNAQEAVEFYVSVFPNSKIVSTSNYPNSMEEGLADFQLNLAGKVLTVEFELGGQLFTAINAGPDFKFTEAISFAVYCKDQAEIDYFWEKLSSVPEADLPAPRPGTYFVYIIHCDDDSMYIGQTEDLRNRWKKHNAGTAAEHTRRHKPLGLIHYEEFNSRKEAVQREKKLKTGFGRKWIKREWKAGRTRQAGQCGWCKDKYGLSWQIVPENMEELMGKPDAFAKLMQMKKLVIEDF